MPVWSGPVPEAVKTRLIMVTGSELGLDICTCITGKLVTPGCWAESAGEAGPTLTDKITGVGDDVTVRVAVAVTVRVGEGVGTFAVGVRDGVRVGVAVGVNVRDGVSVKMGVQVRVGVKVGVSVGKGVSEGVYVAVKKYEFGMVGATEMSL
jgi:hypothetical protein